MDDVVDRLADLLARTMARRWIAMCAEEKQSQAKDTQAAAAQDETMAIQDNDKDGES